MKLANEHIDNPQLMLYRRCLFDRYGTIDLLP
jgi:hypothetical protein